MSSPSTPIPALHTALARYLKATGAQDEGAARIARAQVFGAALAHPDLLGQVRLIGASDCAMATVNTVGDAIVTVDSRGNLRLWDARDGALRERMEVTAAIRSVAFAGPLERGMLGAVGGHGEAVVMLPSTGQQVNLNAVLQSDVHFEGVLPFGGHETALCFVGETSVVVALDGLALRVGGFDHAWVLALSPDLVIRSNDDDAFVIETDTRSFTLTEGPTLESVDDIVIGPGGAHVVFRQDQTLQIYACSDDGVKPLCTLQTPSDERHWAMAFSPDGDLVMLRARRDTPVATSWRWTPGEPEARATWELRTGAEGAEPALIAMAMDASTAFVLDGSQNQGLVIDVGTGALRSRIRGFEPHEVVGWTMLDVDPRAELAAIHSVVGEDQQMSQLTELHAIDSGVPLLLLADWGQIQPGSRVAFSNDGARFAVPRRDGLCLYAFQAPTRPGEEGQVEELRQFEPYTDFGVDASPSPAMAAGFDVEGRWLGVGFGGYLGEPAWFGLYGLEDDAAKWSCRLGQEKPQEIFVLNDAHAVVRARDGIYWCARDKAEAHRLDMSGNVRDTLFALLPGGRLAGWWEGALHLFEGTEDGAPDEVSRLLISGHVERLVAADEGRFLVSLGVGQARVWEIVERPRLLLTVYGESAASWGSPWLLTRDGDGLAIRDLASGEIHMFADVPPWMARRAVPEISAWGNAIVARSDAELFVVDLFGAALEKALSSDEEDGEGEVGEDG